MEETIKKTFYIRTEITDDGKTKTTNFIFSSPIVSYWENKLRKKIECPLFVERPCNLLDKETQARLLEGKLVTHYIGTGKVGANSSDSPKLLFTEDVRECCAVTIYCARTRVGILGHIRPAPKSSIYECISLIMEKIQSKSKETLIPSECCVNVFTGVITEHLLNTCSVLTKDFGFKLSSVHYQPIVAEISTSGLQQDQYYCSKRFELLYDCRKSRSLIGKDYVPIYWKDSITDEKPKELKIARNVAMNSKNGIVVSNSKLTLCVGFK